MKKLLILGILLAGSVALTGCTASKPDDCLSTATPWIKVISPNGGESYHAGQQITVTWESCNINQSVGVTLSGFPYPNDTQFFLGNWINGANGTETVTIPATATTGNYILNVATPPESSPGAEDWSDTSFTINGTEQQKTISLKVFFPNSVMDPGFLDCNIVHPASRTIPYTLATSEASLKELIKGPTALEESQGFQTQIDSNTTIKSISIKNGIVYVDFSKELQNKNLGLCAGQFIVAQIRETLLQFPTIKDVIFSVEGVSGDFVQP